MYVFALSLHNIMRWVVLILGLIAVVNAFIGWFGKREWTNRDRRIGSFFAISLDIQILLGLILYFALSPITKAFLQDFGAGMGVTDLRYYGIEHIFYMIVAAVLAHVGGAQARRATTSEGKFKRAAIFFSLALLVVLAGIPWGRPILRLFS